MNMQTVEHDSTAVACVSADSETPNVGYAAVRFNAMKHGILSRLAVLAHEDQAEFSDLLAALLDEHQPAGMTERHLIEELATIIWRKRRVLAGRGREDQRGLKSTLSSPKSVMPSAAPFQRGLSGENTDLRDLFDVTTPADNAESLKSAELDLAAGQKAAAILRKGGANAYEKARRALIPESRDWWDEHVADEEHPPPPKGWPNSSAIRWNRSAIAWFKRRDLLRQSRRKPWVKGCKRTGWRS
jgi:hypothetical protein